MQNRITAREYLSVSNMVMAALLGNVQDGVQDLKVRQTDVAALAWQLDARRDEGKPFYLRS